MLKKRGISAIVATVLIILITVAAVTIIWVAIIPLIQDQLDIEGNSVKLQIVTFEGYTVWDSVTKLVTVQVKRGSDEVDLRGISFIFSFSGSSLTIVKNESLGPNQKLIYHFNSSKFGKPDSVSIAPVFSDNHVGEISSTQELVSGVLIDGGEDWTAIVGSSEEESGVEPEPCVYGGWNNLGCGLGGCLEGEFYLTREVARGDDCFETTSCVEDSYCVSSSEAVSYWKFEGDLNDENGLADGVINGDENYVSGRNNIGIALDLDGNDYVSGSADFGLAPNSVSFSVWIKPATTIGSWRAIFEYSRTTPSWFGAWLSSSGNFHWRIGGKTMNSIQILSPNQWYFLTGTYDSTINNLSVYIDGEYDSSSIGAPGSFFVSPASKPFNIGRSLNGGEFFNGTIDDVMIFNRSLSAEEVKTIYDSTKEGAYNTLSLEDYYDKAYGAWLGQIAGNFLGMPTEGVYSGASPLPVSEIYYFNGTSKGYSVKSSYTPINPFITGTCEPGDYLTCIVKSQTDDDTSIEWLDLYILETYGLNPSYENIKNVWLSYMVSGVYFANRYASDLMRGVVPPSDGIPPCEYSTFYNCTSSGESCPAGGCVPPYTGKEHYNAYFDFIDSQIEIETFGALSPGMKSVAAGYADKFARITNEGYAVDYAKFYAMMYSEAFFDDDVSKIIDKVKSEFPPSSRVHEIIEDIQGWKEAYPDWRDTRRQIYEKYYIQEKEIYNDGRVGAWWIHSTVNFASTIMAILYSGGDFDTGIQIATLAGWDNDCNAPTTAGLLGVISGASGIPAKWKNPIRDFYDNTNKGNLPDDTVTNIAQRTVDLGEQIILANGGVKQGNILNIFRD